MINSACSHYIVGTCQEQCGNLKAALIEVEAALNLDVADSTYLAGKAALILHETESDLTDDELTTAGRLLERASAGLRPDSPKRLIEDLELLQVLFQAMTGEGTLARLRMERLRAEHPLTERYGKALEALSH